MHPMRLRAGMGGKEKGEMKSRETIETIKRAAAEVEWEYPMEYMEE